GLRRLATGALLGIDPKAMSLPPIHLYPSEEFRCVDSGLGLPRAFHSATRLPNGQVLIFGGLTASADKATAKATDGFEKLLYVTATAEIYDPSDGLFHPATAEGAMPRAFHHAALAGGSYCPASNYALLLVGGLTGNGAEPALGVNTGQPGGRLVPFDTS